VDTDATVREYTIDAGALRMHVREAGRGQPVLLLHGFPQSGRTYAPVIADLATDARVIAPDLRGAGETDAPRDGYDSTTLRADLVALLDALEVEAAAIVAHSSSAIVGFDLCLEHPERVTEYVAIQSPAPYLRMTPKLAGAMMHALPQLWFQWAIAVPVIGPRLLSRGRQRLPYWMMRHFETNPMSEDDVQAHVAALRDPARARAGSLLYRQLVLPGIMNLARGKYRGRVLRTRTLVLFGAEDRNIPPDALAISLDDAPNTTVERIPGGGQYLIDDNPAELTRRIRQFLGLPER
jgi:pimeloyl-ACP methyl ester carboxylesterase